MLISNRFCSWDFAHYHKWEKQNNHDGIFFFYHWQVLLPVMMKWENTTMGHTYSNCQQWQTITNHWEWYTQTASISKTSKPHGGYIQKAVASNGQTSKLLGVIYTNSCQQWQNHWVSYTQTVASNGKTSQTTGLNTQSNFQKWQNITNFLGCLPAKVTSQFTMGCKSINFQQWQDNATHHEL